MNYLELYDFRQRVAAMYRERNVALARGDDAVDVCQKFRTHRDELFRTHPQSALDEDQRAGFTSLKYLPYNHEASSRAVLEPLPAHGTTIAPTSGPDGMPLIRAGWLHFTFGAAPYRLTVYWIDVYGGGLFVPFRDTTAPQKTYGGGRYLIDTVKGSDFPFTELNGPEVVVNLDFNYAYNPSCAYHHKWICPLAPPENQLPYAVEAGELAFISGTAE